MSETVPAPAQPVAPTLLQLFVAFSVIALSGFGGVLAWSRRMMVDERKWMTAEEFNDSTRSATSCRANIVNFSAVFGRRFGGIRCAAGAARPSWTAVRDRDLDRGAVTRLRQHRSPAAHVRAVAAPAGLTISTAVKMFEPLKRERIGARTPWRWATFVAVGVLRWPIYWVLGVLIPAEHRPGVWVRR